MTREMVEEARGAGRYDAVPRLSGRQPQLRVPLLIIEGKAWAKPFVTRQMPEPPPRDASSPHPGGTDR